MVNLCLGEKSGDGDRAAGIANLRVKERLLVAWITTNRGDDGRPMTDSAFHQLQPTETMKDAL
jgi:hypothetical protein